MKSWDLVPGWLLTSPVQCLCSDSQRKMGGLHSSRAEVSIFSDAKCHFMNAAEPGRTLEFQWGDRFQGLKASNLGTLGPHYAESRLDLQGPGRG